MTRDETKKLLFMISGAFPNFKPEDKTLAVDTWQFLLGELDAEEVFRAFKIYATTESKGYAPTAGQLVEIIRQQKSEDLTELEAWDLVRKAMRNGNYNAVEEFKKLPNDVKVAVGSAANIQEWASKDSGEIETVIMSQFLRAFRTVNERIKSQPDYIDRRIETYVDDVELIESKDTDYVVAPDYIDEVVEKLVIKGEGNERQRN